MTTFILEQINGHKLGKEEQLIADYLTELKQPFIKMTLKQMRRRNIFNLKNNFVPVGSIDFMYAAMSKLNIPRPPTNDYPKNFNELDFGRPIPTITQLGLLTELDLPVFIKPAEKLKAFNGFVLKDFGDFRYQSLRPKMKVWVSEVIEFVYEYRVYVVNGEPMMFGRYFGDSAVNSLAIGAITSWCYVLAKQGSFNYALDIGIKPNGDHVIVEFNDGFSLGYYTEPESVRKELPIFIQLLKSRWLELLTTRID